MPHKRTTVSNTYTSNNRATLVRGGKGYFDTLLKMIHEAKESIHLQTYIFTDDETGRMVANALKEAAQRNVSVYLILDGYASQDLSHAFIKDLENAGICFRFFHPIFKGPDFYFGRRMHHKVVVVDAKFALVGGVNISNRYNDLPGQPAWLDFALLTEGETARQLCILCSQIWRGRLTRGAKKPLCGDGENGIVVPENERSEIRIRRNDWVRRKNQVSQSYLTMLRNAQSHATFLCSYFLPGKRIRKQMILAIKRGVSVRVIAAGRSDVVVAKQAERWLYDWLLRNGVELYEYNKNILHGKVAVCDDRWMTIGSYNINSISAYASIELNLDVRSETLTKKTRETFDEIIANDCTRINAEDLSKTKNIFKQLIRWLSYQFVRVAFHLFTFYFRKGGGREN